MKDDRIVAAAADVFTERFETEFGDVNTAQKGATELRLVNEFFATLERQGRPALLLSKSETSSADQDKQRCYRITESDQSMVKHPYLK